MRSVRHRAFVPVAAVAASTALLSCHRGDSILLVEVAGDLSLAPTALTVSVQPAQAAPRTFMITPKDGSTISLPTSLSVEMAPNLTGPVTVEAGAIVGTSIVATGKTTLADINVGGETIVAVMLTGGAPPAIDAGTDATPGTGGTGATGGGGTGGDIGTGGTIGTGGAAGKGGVTGSGGAAGKGGAMGSGGATGTGGATGSGGATGTGGATGSGGATGTGGSGGHDASAADAGADA
jgi:hypothetical protein